MLKTLEEPAGRTLIMLLSDAPESLLPTIRSRCQLVTFRRLPNALIVAEPPPGDVPVPLAVMIVGEFVAVVTREIVAESAAAL